MRTSTSPMASCERFKAERGWRVACDKSCAIQVLTSIRELTARQGGKLFTHTASPRQGEME